MSLDFPLSLGSRNLCFVFSVSEGGKGAVFLLCFLPPVPEKEILDFIAHSSIYRNPAVSRQSVPKPSQAPVVPATLPSRHNLPTLTLSHTSLEHRVIFNPLLVHLPILRSEFLVPLSFLEVYVGNIRIETLSLQLKSLGGGLATLPFYVFWHRRQ